ncbi:hypothetical protein [Paenibacillus prosopidis]|nr:hypothetical protein [Paenibacillus prosopidis]
MIHSLDRGSSSNNGYITASTMITEPFGYLFFAVFNWFEYKGEEA